MATRPILSLLITCEHASNFIPERWRAAFKGTEAVLWSHQGWDPGALELAAAVQRATAAPMIRGDVSRLLVELNRSEDHPQLFSGVSSGFDDDEKRLLLERFYRPYRLSVQESIEKLLNTRPNVIHLSVHSFTPVWEGKERDVDIGILFDPERQFEVHAAGRLKDSLVANTAFRIRDNEPYKGTDDGLTTYLRTCFPASSYAGIEIEISQRFPLGDPAEWGSLKETIAQSVKSLIL